jgi:hypothetical protein
MKKEISTIEKLLIKNKDQIKHLPALRPTYFIQVGGEESFTINLSSNTVSAGNKWDADSTIYISSPEVLKEVMTNPTKAWIYSGQGGEIKVSDNISAAILLESLYPGTLAATLSPRQFYGLFPHLIPNEYAGHTTEDFFNLIIPNKLVSNSQILSTVIAAFQFNIEGAGIWTIDLTTSVPQVYTGPAKSKGSIISTDRKTFEEILNDDSKAWGYFNSGKIIVSNACRASQVVNALWPGAFAKAMPGALHVSLFPGEAADPSVSEYNKTSGEYITYVGGKNGLEKIYYSVLGDLAIYEGDIILGKAVEMENVRKHVEEKVSLPEGVRIIDWGNRSKYLWPGGVVYYKVDSSLTNEAGKELKKAMDYWQSKTKITFKERKNEANYVVIKDSSGCSSAVGMVGGLQNISLNKECSFGNVVHEIGHTIGLFHEQCRIDRDTYVTIEWTQIIEDKKHNFDKKSISRAENLGSYDYGSIMHYGANAFAKGKKPTIVTIPPGKAIGQRDGLSTGDISSVVAMYGAKEAIQQEVTDYIVS